MTDEADISDKINVFFTSVGSNMSTKFKNYNGNPLRYISSTLYSISIPEFSEIDIITVISSLKNSSAGYMMTSQVLKLKRSAMKLLNH